MFCTKCKTMLHIAQICQNWLVEYRQYTADLKTEYFVNPVHNSYNQNITNILQTMRAIFSNWLKVHIFHTFKHLISHLLISCVFQNFEIDFWPLLKAEKVLPPNKFLFSIIHMKDRNFQPAGFLSFKEKSGPLLPLHI